MELDISSYATRTDFKNVAHVDVISFALKANLDNLKTEADKLDISKLTPVPNGLAKFSNAVKNDVVKWTEYDKLITKVDNINATGDAAKTKYHTDKSDLEIKISDAEKKIPSTSAFVKKTGYNSKITALQSKIPSISGLATKSAFTTVENKIPDVSSVGTKANCNIKLNEFEKKITDLDDHKRITISQFNKLTTETFKARLAQAGLLTKTHFDTEFQDIVNELLQINLDICLLQMN